MFRVGERVRYGVAGVCRIEKIGAMDFGEKEQDYYVLMPLFKPGSFLYVPVENADLVAKMKPLLTPDEIDAALCRAKEKDPEWVRDFRLRSERAKTAIASADRSEALILIKNILFHKNQIAKEGKKIHTTDDYFLRDAENLIYFEFSVVLNEEYECVAERIRNQLERSFERKP